METRSEGDGDPTTQQAKAMGGEADLEPEVAGETTLLSSVPAQMATGSIKPSGLVAMANPSWVQTRLRLARPWRSSGRQRGFLEVEDASRILAQKSRKEFVPRRYIAAVAQGVQGSD